ncbi:hypothetical protein [Pedobacter boryungensis]|uniref:LTXXQ motif family protein n=1 Tax=Pedobacter boryungensis TaxID=869962 RepID=A0ABX2DGS5_9SPHI|nr:hypothetical protein [Pedobacter boryungensis]NQX32511.1 hypothetical protein [Pedobacter boryungensis]
MNLIIKHTIKIFLIFFFAVSFHSNVFAQAKTYRPAKEPFASLSSSEKLEVQKKLIAKLRTDTDFIAMQKAENQFFNDRASKAKKSSDSEIKNADSLKSKRSENTFQIFSTLVILMKKYPELRQLDSETLKTVMRQARAK